MLTDAEKEIVAEARRKADTFWDHATDPYSGLLGIINRLSADLETYGKDTELTENRIIDAEFAATETKSITLSSYTDDEIAREHHWRMLSKLGDPRTCAFR